MAGSGVVTVGLLPALGSIESRWLVIGEGEYDLSEQNMAACHGFDTEFGQGGNIFMAMAYLTTGFPVQYLNHRIHIIF